MVPRGIWCSRSKGPVDLLASPEMELSALGLERHERGVEAERRGLLLFLYHASFDPGDGGRLS